MSAALACFPTPRPQPPPRPAQATMTKHEICAKLGISLRWFERKVQNPGVIFITPKTARNGRPEKHYVIASLPADLRDRLELRTKLEPPTPAAFQQAADANQRSLLFADTHTGGSYPSSTLPTPVRLQLSPEAEAQAQARYRAIQPLLEFGANRERYSHRRLADGTPVGTARQLAQHIAEMAVVEGKAVSVSTLFGWVGRFREAGLPGLVRQQRNDKGTSHFFTRYPAAATLAKSVFLRPGTVTRAYKAIVRDQLALGIPPADLPSYATVRNYLDTLPEPEKILAREGQRRWNETCAPHLTRGYTDVAAGAIFTADHMIHDVEVRNDCFASVEQNAPMRLRFTAIMDLRTRKIVGYCWTVDGDSRSIATALRRAVERFGCPEVFYCDNGSDFKKLGRGATKVGGAEIEKAGTWLEGLGALQMLGIKLQLCLPYHPQSKNIERAFRTVHLGLDAIFHTYLTGNAYNRPDAAVLAGTEHRRLVKQGRGNESSLMPASLFIKLAETWIEGDYNAGHLHSGNGMNRRTPNAVWEELVPSIRRQPRSVRAGLAAVRAPQGAGAAHGCHRQQAALCAQPAQPGGHGQPVPGERAHSDRGVRPQRSGPRGRLLGRRAAAGGARSRAPECASPGAYGRELDADCRHEPDARPPAEIHRHHHPDHAHAGGAGRA